MELSDDLLCLFSAPVEERAGSYVIELPEREVTLGETDADSVYRVAVLAREADVADGERASDPDRREASASHEGPTPPVTEGDERVVDIEGIGEQGDGIARVERGYVLIVPDTEKGERVTVRVTTVRENVAFAEVTEREEYYE
ncbi:TRAM domain-containing protein [Natronorarus salvus]|uniref:TRAM domain-containing protein n=1 Tax=Natronorarus salvus TaxID=3117733 RepID=UPI002F269491